MALPKVGFCLLCEGVRPELNHKANILGFYGVLPDAAILVGELGKPVAVLLFLAGVRGPSDDVIMKAEILDPEGSSIAASDDTPFPGIPDDSSGLSGFAFAPVVFSKEGKHYFRLSINGEEKYKQTFLIRRMELPQ